MKVFFLVLWILSDHLKKDNKSFTITTKPTRIKLRNLQNCTVWITCTLLQ